MLLTTRRIHVCALIYLTYSIDVSGQVPTQQDAWTVQRVIVAENDVYAFAKWEGDKKAGPQFVKMRVAANGNSHEGVRYDLWGSWWTNYERIPMRWRVNADTLYTGCHVDNGGPAEGQAAVLACWPLTILIPGPRAMFVHGTYQKVWEQTTRFGLSPVSGAAGGTIKLTESGYIGKGPGAFEVERVNFDFQVVEGNRVELLMTIGGRTALWEYDGVQDTEEWKNRSSMVGNRIVADADEVYLRSWGWHHKKNLPVTIEGPFLWMQNPQYVVAERNGAWCVIGPLDVANPPARRIAATNPDNPLFLVEDIHAGKDYFRLGDELMDDTGKTIDRIDSSQSADEQLQQIAQFVISRR